MGLKIIHEDIEFDGKFIQVLKRRFIGIHGEEGIWECVRRKTNGRIVAIAAITYEREIILTKIFRVPINEYVIELPAGLMDKNGESEEDAVRRELLEETGYVVDGVRLLVSGPFNAGLLADEIAIYLGVNARFVQQPKHENAENMEVVKVPISKLVSFLTKLGEVKKDVKIAAIVPFLEKKIL